MSISSLIIYVSCQASNQNKQKLINLPEDPALVNDRKWACVVQPKILSVQVQIKSLHLQGIMWVAVAFSGQLLHNFQYVYTLALWYSFVCPERLKKYSFALWSPNSGFETGNVSSV